MLFAHVCAGFFRSWYGGCGDRWFLCFLASPRCLVHPGGASFAGLHPCVYQAWVSKICLLLEDALRAEVGGGIIFVTLGVCWAAQNTACQIGEKFCGFTGIELYMPASVGRPSLHTCYACMVFWARRASRRYCRENHCETPLSPNGVFLFGRNSRVRFWGLI